MQYTVKAEDSGKTVKTLIAELLQPSSKMLKYLKYREDGILLNSSRVTVRATVREGDLLTLSLLDPQDAQSPEAVDLPLSILYEDSDLVVPSKPGNMPTHPSRDHYRDTVANALAYCRAWRARPDRCPHRESRAADRLLRDSARPADRGARA